MAQKQATCLDCQQEFVDGKKLSLHLKKVHNMTFEEYVIKHKYNGIRPLCPNCGNETRFTRSFESGFKKYCKNCSHIAESEGGKIGGKIKQTWCKGHTKETHPMLARFSEDYSGSGNPFYGKKHSRELQDQISEKNRCSLDEINEYLQEHLPTISIVDYDNDYKTRQGRTLRVKCSECNSIDVTSFFNIQRCWRCHTCHPNGSRSQLEIFDYVKSLGYFATSSDRTIIKPYELDIWIPSKKLAIEYNGLYWHAMANSETIDHKRHFLKRELCDNLGIQLIQIYSDEWNLQPELCKSFIKSSLSSDPQKFISSKHRFIGSSNYDFLNANHLGPYRESDQLVDIISNESNKTVASVLYKFDNNNILCVSDFVVDSTIEICSLLISLKEYANSPKLYLLLDADKYSINQFITHGFKHLHSYPEPQYIEGHYRSFYEYPTSTTVLNSGVHFLIV